MYSTATIASVAAAIAAIPAVNAHGYVVNVIAGGKTIFAGDPTWPYKTDPQQPGWFAMNQDNGFVAPAEYTDPDIICHKKATPGSTSVTVAAGDTVGLQWNTWPTSHHGPVINALAPVSGDFASIDKTALEWVVYEEGGLDNDNPPPGTWATDDLIANNFTGEFTFPASLAPGNYVLRHEIIALHAANSLGGAQNYPQCINFVVTGGGSLDPAGAAYVGAYHSTDPGIYITIYDPIATYTMPGLPLYSGGAGSGSAPTTTKGSAAPTTTAKPTTTAASTTLKTTTKAPTTTTTTVAPTTTTQAANCAAKYAQCGGQGWNGATCCASGSTCKASGQYYSQCL